jgi:hypothetical protein
MSRPWYLSCSLSFTRAVADEVVGKSAALRAESNCGGTSWNCGEVGFRRFETDKRGFWYEVTGLGFLVLRSKLLVL